MLGKIRVQCEFHVFDLIDSVFDQLEALLHCVGDDRIIGQPRVVCWQVLLHTYMQWYMQKLLCVRLAQRGTRESGITTVRMRALFE